MVITLSKPTLISPAETFGVPVSGYSIGNNSITNTAPIEASTSVMPALEHTVKSPPKEPSVFSSPPPSSPLPISPPPTPPVTTTNNTLLYALLGIGSLAAVSAGIYVYMKRGDKK